MEEAKNVNKEIAGTLEAVMTSHTQLQSIVENLQVSRKTVLGIEYV